MAKRPSSKAAVALSAVAICGTIAYFGSPSATHPQHDFSLSASAVESYHLPPLSALSPSSLHDATPLQPSGSDPRRRRLSNALPNGGCEITWPQKPPPGVQITYAASYPGCGARMTWNLVEALTGLWTGDDWNNNGRGDEVVTVKTHYPQSNGILVDFDERIQRGFIVIRNPMKSIPSFFNHIYEMRNHLPVHSERAPLEEWIKWRDAYLDTEIAEYKKFITYWMDRYSAANRLLITYEGLTDDLIGSEVAKGLNEFLGQATGVTTIAQDSVACIWRAVVKNQPPPQQAAQIKKLQQMKEAEEQGQQLPQQQQQRQQIGASPQLQQQIPAGNTASLDQQLLEAQKQLQEGKQLIQNTQGQQLQPSSQQGAPSVEQQLLETQQQLQLLQAQQQLSQQQSPGLRRRLDPGHHDSQRKGPEVPRPYTPEQLEKMMNMLLEVGERYQKEDVRLYHIMMGYYEKIREERMRLSPEVPVGAKPPGGYF